MDGLGLPQNPWLWGLLVVGVVLAVFYALSRPGVRLKLGFGSGNVEVGTSTTGEEKAVSVADRLVVEDDARVGNIVGKRGGDAAGAGPVRVANDATIGRGAQTGDIVGVDTSAPEPRQPRDE